MTSTKLPLTVTVEQAAKLAGISRRHGYKLVKDGVIPSVHLGGAIRVPTPALIHLLSGAAEPAARPPSQVARAAASAKEARP